ncbi:Uncharacterised protein [Mycobacteroides abscessus subsp. bolletii]|uniref:hypothetical protein n=1 Tax=Mycobacteroides abscessus TaxID=36809 RepID=UPI0009A7227F|nr:hypothetical protein [Mycobacteroides abscessus]SKX94047.1 Uncharacterised protein [Mycobacteroides abscessus subsp. bolletii]
MSTVNAYDESAPISFGEGAQGNGYFRGSVVDPDLQVHAHALSAKGSPAEQADAAFAHANKEFRKFLDKIPTGTFTPEGRQAHIAKFAETGAVKAADTALEAVRAEHAAAASARDGAYAALVKPGDTATELRNTRYWNRIQSELNSESNSSKLLPLAYKLIKESKPEQLSVLLEEMLPYLRSRGIEKTEEHESISDLVKRAAQEAAPGYKAAVTRAQAAQKALTVAEYNAKRLKQAIKDGRPATRFLSVQDYNLARR